MFRRTGVTLKSPPVDTPGRAVAVQVEVDGYGLPLHRWPGDPVPAVVARAIVQALRPERVPSVLDWAGLLTGAPEPDAQVCARHQGARCGAAAAVL